MVSTAQWNGVLVANLSSERTALGKSEVVGIRGSATTNQTGVLGNRFVTSTAATTRSTLSSPLGDTVTSATSAM